jgi:cytoskeletal protein CcmA (bactofilin family)
MITTKKYKLSFVSAAFALAILSGFSYTPARGSEFKSGDNIEISKLHQIDDDFYAFGKELTVDGTIKGDLMAFVGNCTLRGHLENSVNIASSEFTHQGVIDGTLRIFTQRSNIYGHVGRSLMAFSEKIKLNNGSTVGRDANIFAMTVSLEGTILGDVRIEAESVYVSGIIEGNANIRAGKINIVPPAVIKGNLTYTSKNEAIIDTTTGVTVVGNVTWNLPKEETGTGVSLTSILIRVSCMLATFIFALIVFRIFRPYALESFYQLKDRLAASFAAGLLGLLILILCLFILFVSAMLFLIGVILISNDIFFLGSLLLVIFTLLIPITSFTSVSGGLIFYSGKIIVAALIGYLLTRGLRSTRKELGASSLLLGLVILLVLFSIPYVGFYIYILTGIAGGGAIFLGVKKCNRIKSGEQTGISPKPPEVIPPKNVSGDKPPQ